MKSDGLGGAILRINLTKENSRETSIEPSLIKNYLGGWGLNAKLFFENQKPEVAPYSEDAKIIFGIGTLLGSNTPGASKITATYKTPIEDKEGNHFIDSAMGSTQNFGMNLKRGGHDHVIISGKAKKPTYLVIDNGEVKFRDATDIWGELDSYETIDYLKEQFSGDPGILSIGSAGEEKVRYAMTILEKTRTLGRFGLGGVLGSKNIKAILIKGKDKLSIYNKSKLNKINKNWMKDIINSQWGYKEYLKTGINAKFNFLGEKAAEGPMAWEKAMKIFSYKKYKDLTSHCPNESDRSCPIPCRAEYKIKEGEFKGEKTHTGNWFLPIRVGQRLNIENSNKALKLLDVCNRSGLCVFTTSQIVNWITLLSLEKELPLNSSDLKREFDTYLDLFNNISKRKGVGEVLAQGWRPIQDKIREDPEEHFFGTGIIQGIDPIQDARNTTLSPQAFQHLTGTRPHHGGHQSLYTRPNKPLFLLKKDAQKMGLTNKEIERVFTETPYYGSFNVGRYTKHVEDHMAVLNSLGMCGIHAYWGDLSEILDLKIKYANIRLLSKIYSSFTGIDLSPRQLKKSGERAFNLFRLLQFREGIKGFPDLPETWFKTKETPDDIEIKMKDYYREKELEKEDVKKLLRDYRKERKWNKEAFPTQIKRKELKLRI